jgi:tricorn protease
MADWLSRIKQISSTGSGNHYFLLGRPTRPSTRPRAKEAKEQKGEAMSDKSRPGSSSNHQGKNVCGQAQISRLRTALFALGMTLFVIVAVSQTARAQANPQNDARLLRFPDISDNNIVFTYAGDLWTVPRKGGTARRLTANPGLEQFAKFSPDGRWVAFSAQYDGNTDVYLMPAEGGEPRRLTYHPAADLVVGWTPDSKRVLFRSQRTSFSQRFNKLFTISIEGGMPEELVLPAGGLSSFSADGSKIAYNRVETEFRTWKRYRGGWHQFISIYDFKNNSYDEVPHTLAADMFPMWYKDSIYFDSDRDGVMNLYKYDLPSKEIKQLTQYREYDVKFPSLGGANSPAIVYENGGYLYSMDLKSEQPTQVPVTVESDMSWARPEYVKADKYVTSFGLSPSGARAVFGARGDVFTVPAKKGDVRNLTNTSGTRELWPVWSPDGKWIAYFSDATGEYELYIRPQDGSGPEKRITTDAQAYRYGPKWSPDSSKLLFAEKTLKLFYVDINDGKPVLVDQSHFGTINEYDWSGDGKWIAYAKGGANSFARVYLFSTEQRKSTAITEGTTNDHNPVFDQNGKYLYFLGDRTFEPSITGFELNLNFDNTTGVYAVTLAADTPSPFFPPSDEEKGAAKPSPEPGQPDKAAPGASKEATAPKPAGPDAKTEPKEGTPKDTPEPPKPIKVDLENINRRIVRVPVPPGNYGHLLAASDRLFYIAATQASGQAPPVATLHTYDVAKQEDTVLLAGIQDYDIDQKGDKAIYSAGPLYGIIEIRPGQHVGDGQLDLSGMEIKIDPRAEWKQIFNEAWRIERDFYYDPTMRGLDWNAIKARYEKELPYVAHRTDLNYLIGEMIAELSTSHSYVGGGDVPETAHVNIGLLGADFESANGYYRFKKIYSGDNSVEETRSPLTEPGVVVHEGDYLISVSGKPVKQGDNVFASFENTVGKQVTMKVNDKPSEEGARSVVVRPRADETALRYLSWVEENRRKVSEATGGRCGYIHVPDTAIVGMENFAKGFYAQTDKDAVIVDERWNSGGFVPDFFVERLQRQLLSYVAPREGEDVKVPGAAIIGPKVMLANEYSGSGGDAFPFFFREAGLGPIVGMRTWGGLVGIAGGLPMVDGGFVTAPEIAFWWNKDGKSEWIVENKGVSPDYEVDERPDLVISGHDPQLEKALEIIKDELAKHPPVHPARPKYGPVTPVSP